MYKLTIKTQFSAAHQLRGYQGKCENLHGHNGKVEVTIASEKLDKLGMVIDFKELKLRVGNILDELDHPTRIQVDAEADAAAKLAQMFHGQSQPPRSLSR